MLQAVLTFPDLPSSVVTARGADVHESSRGTPTTVQSFCVWEVLKTRRSQIIAHPSPTPGMCSWHVFLAWCPPPPRLILSSGTLRLSANAQRDAWALSSSFPFTN